MKKLYILLFILIGGAVFSVSAQPPPPPPPGPPGTAAPIDTDANMLLLIATTFGIYKIYKHRKSPIKPTL